MFPCLGIPFLKEFTDVLGKLQDKAFPNSNNNNDEDYPQKKPLAGHVALVTGATRGVGKGVALQLGEAGCTVYVTGRTIWSSMDEKGSLEDTAREVELRGGRCITVPMDHSRDDDVELLFQQIGKEQAGRLDILVNNAYSAGQIVQEYIGTSFWETPTTMWDEVTKVGLRNHYLCTVQAAKMMVPKKKGLIVNISSAGGMRYLFNIPYGVGKEGLDRMAADCAIELWRHRVAMVSLWPGAVQTENIMDMVNGKGINKRIPNAERMEQAFKQGESVEYAGKCIVQLATDSRIMRKSGKVLLTTDLGDEYGFKDINGQVPFSIRSLKGSLALGGHSKLAAAVPKTVNLPRWVFSLSGSKFQ